jgi:hypothetical protein
VLKAVGISIKNLSIDALKRQLPKYFGYLVIYISFVRGEFIYLTNLMKGDFPYQTSEWLINYGSGFVRRGLFGSLFLFLTPNQPWKVLLTARASFDAGTKAHELFRAAGCSVTVSEPFGPLDVPALTKAVHGYDAVLASSDAYNASFFASPDIADLKIVSRWGVGLDCVDLAAATQAGVVICNTPGLLDEAVADYAWALLFAVARRVDAGQPVRAVLGEIAGQLHLAREREHVGRDAQTFDDARIELLGDGEGFGFLQHLIELAQQRHECANGHGMDGEVVHFLALFAASSARLTSIQSLVMVQVVALGRISPSGGGARYSG